MDEMNTGLKCQEVIDLRRINLNKGSETNSNKNVHSFSTPSSKKEIKIG